MIKVIMALFLIILTALILLYWVDILSNFSNEDKKSDYCYGCKCGFCMEIPGSGICKKVKKEFDRLNGIVEEEEYSESGRD